MFEDPILWIAILVLFSLFASGMYILIQINKRYKRIKRRPRPVKAQEQKDWKAASLRLEKHIYALRKENINWQKKTKVLEKELEIFKVKNDELSEKLDRERLWQKKEEEDAAKKNKRTRQLENELKAMEQKIEQEHSELIVFRRENQEIKETTENQIHQIKYLQGDIQKAQVQCETYRKEILDLRSENKKLSRKHEDVQWIAKSVHMKVKDELYQARQEIKRLTEQQKAE